MDTTSRGPAPRGAGPLADAAIALFVPVTGRRRRGDHADEDGWTDDAGAAPGVID
jgi:hypothetical protein